MDFSIALSFLILASICLWFIIGAKGKTISKMIMISVATLFSYCVYTSLISYKGWATEQALPEDFFVKWTIVKEPYEKDEGAIYIWVKERGTPNKKDLFFYDEEFGNPRAHKIPYSPKMHEVAQKMQQKLMKGETVIGKGKKKGKGGKGDQELEMVSGEEGKFGSFNFSKEMDIEFYTLPKGSVLRK
jgi:hypothetical protein